VSETCPNKRHYIKNRDQISQSRKKQRIEVVHQVVVPQVTYGNLLIWRELRQDSPVKSLLRVFNDLTGHVPSIRQLCLWDLLAEATRVAVGCSGSSGAFVGIVAWWAIDRLWRKQSYRL
jgi:hypothetical protein